MNKYRLTKEYILNRDGCKLFRIQALIDFGIVRKGDKGGYIQSYTNLDRTRNGNAWVAGDAEVYGNARVYGNAQVYGNAWVSGDAEVSGNALVFENAWVSEHIFISSGKTVCNLTQNANPIQCIKNSLNIGIYNNKFIAFKRVCRINNSNNSNFFSLHDPAFKYIIGKEAKILSSKNYCWDIGQSCGPGIHVSTANYWQHGDTLIAVEVLLEDVITCQEGKIRCKKVKVLGVCNE